MPAVATKVELIINVGGGASNIYLTDIPNPEGADPGTLFAAISSGATYVSQALSTTGVITYDLGASAVTQINTNSTFFYLGAWSSSEFNTASITVVDPGFYFDSMEGPTAPVLKVTTLGESFRRTMFIT